MASDTVSMSFRVDRKLKEQADDLFKSMGLNTSAALNIFLTQSVNEDGLPFTPTRSKAAEKRLEAAIKELDDMRSGKIPAKIYHSWDEIMEDIK